jgi:hypothetical protein
MLKGKKAMSTEMIFLISLFGIVLLISVFYIWIQHNVEQQTKGQADRIAADVERRIFFSELIHAHGTEIASKNDNEAKTIIENFGKKYSTIEKGSYSAACTTKGTDKECALTISVTPDNLIWKATRFVPGFDAFFLLVKALGLNILDQTKTTAYLPTTGNKAAMFTLDIKVELA